jgi:hypothetical protein
VQYSISDYILDIVQNSVEGEASFITVDFLEQGQNLTVNIGDNGIGIPEEKLCHVLDPFYSDGTKHTNRKVGLGLPFLKQAAEQLQGSFDITSEEELGTSVSFLFPLENIDCPPFGNLPSLFRSLMLFERDYDLLVYRKKDENSYRVTRSELAEALGSLYDIISLPLLLDYFSSLEEELSI